jgi:hypothetical protein
MHDRLSEILEREVIGEVVQVGDAFFDRAFGRIELPTLNTESVDALVGKLRLAFDSTIEVDDMLNFDDSNAILRGLVEVRLPDTETGNSYCLQLTNSCLVALYETRFWLSDTAVGDLMGTLCRGLSPLVFPQGEIPLRVLSGYDGLRQRFCHHLSGALAAAKAGDSWNADAAIFELATSVQAAWRLIPHALKSALHPLWQGAHSEPVQHDPIFRDTIMFAANAIDGDIVYEYEHQHNPLEEYGEVKGWMTEVHQAVVATYPVPEFVVAFARASSVEQFRLVFPGYRQLLGPRPEAEGDTP